MRTKLHFVPSNVSLLYFISTTMPKLNKTRTPAVKQYLSFYIQTKYCLFEIFLAMVVVHDRTDNFFIIVGLKLS